MRKIMLSAALMAAILFSGLLLAEEYTGPKMTVSELTHDFGNVVQGTVATWIFEVRNDGIEQLVIERIQPS